MDVVLVGMRAVAVGLVCSVGIAQASPADDAAIARVEHGLVREVRVQGDPPGWTIDERLAAHHVPAVSVAVIHDYRVVWARAYGFADLAAQARASPDTLFQAASISKMVTALAALEQADAGRVALDADINGALRSWKLPHGAYPPVTLTQLLDHTAGVNVHSVPGYREGATLPTLRQILDGAAPATNEAVRVEHAAGSFAYSGGGYLVVQQLVADLLARPFDDAMDRAVFTPLGMTSSTFTLPFPARLQSRRALAYDTDETPLPSLVNPESAPAGLWTTPTDLARFLIEVQLADEGGSRKIPTRVAKWLTKAGPPVGPPDVWMGLGAFVEKHGTRMYFGHDGWNDGFLSTSRAMLDRGDGAIAMTNGAGGGPLLFEILRSIAVEYAWDGWLPPPIELAKLSAAQLDAYRGRYRRAGEADGSILVRRQGDRLVGIAALREPLELIPIGGDTFVNRANGDHFHFRRDAQSRYELVDKDKDSEVVLARIADDAREPSGLLAAGKHDDAAAAYRAARTLHADRTTSETYLDALGRQLLDTRFDVGSALAVFRVEAALFPDSANANAALAFAYLRAGRMHEGASFYARALALRDAPHPAPADDMETVYLNWRLSRIKAAQP